MEIKANEDISSDLIEKHNDEFVDEKVEQIENENQNKFIYKQF